ncbi:MAG TPA: RES family NAD+ phosphorylase [Stellaceae bacterium]|nr:RES family NAD+ phosphorylase [Stellaceae bacterium]
MLPPPGYAKTSTPITAPLLGRRFFRLYTVGQSALGFGYADSRFSDPRSPPRFGVAYFGERIETCFVERIIRDKRNGLDGPLLISQRELDRLMCVEIEVASDVVAIDLVGRNIVRNGIDTDVVGASDQALARQWSVAFHAHRFNLAGVLYDSRLIGEPCLAVYDRALHGLKPLQDKPLLQWPRHLAHILRTYNVAIAP